ncbi:NUDIX hydrolase [Telluribacter humicola]|uniref:NUDIX hydrolase n=1 Tax=Telluribacter humicola TaxID=1720261 RepID=UPI001A95BC23|nr:NUDIX domain-containing protein [Telluribacter humicola]
MPYTHTHRILIALDCIIFGFDGEGLNLLLVKRNFEPEFGKWSLMGGFLNEGESLEEAAHRIVFDLTGLDNHYLEQFQTFGATTRDPVERTVSVAYYALVNIEDQDMNAIRSHNASWISLHKKPYLIFDHDIMVEEALKRLRTKAALNPIGFELLPGKFTIPQLQKLYEAIYDTKLDRRNFSRKILSTKLLMGTGEKDMTSQTKKGQLYSLNTHEYVRQQKGNFGFLPELILVDA